MSRNEWDQKVSRAEKRKALRAEALAYMGGKCRLCGYSRCLNALEFHHIETFDKEFTISDRVTTFEKIRPELDKCVLLCANCHREVHDGQHSSVLLVPEEDMRWSGGYFEDDV